MKIHDGHHLAEVIKDTIATHGHSCDLNHLDVSSVTDMSTLFLNSFFDGDISRWDVSNVESMAYMFNKSHFSGDISKWNVGKVRYMTGMFREAPCIPDISPWRPYSLEVLTYFAWDCPDLSGFRVEHWECPLLAKAKEVMPPERMMALPKSDLSTAMRLEHLSGWGDLSILRSVTEQEICKTLGTEVERIKQLLNIHSLLPMNLWQKVQWLKRAPEVGPQEPYLDFNLS